MAFGFLIDVVTYMRAENLTQDWVQLSSEKKLNSKSFFFQNNTKAFSMLRYKLQRKFTLTAAAFLCHGRMSYFS